MIDNQTSQLFVQKQLEKEKRQGKGPCRLSELCETRELLPSALASRLERRLFEMGREQRTMSSEFEIENVADFDVDDTQEALISTLELPLVEDLDGDDGRVLDRAEKARSTEARAEAKGQLLCTPSYAIKLASALSLFSEEERRGEREVRRGSKRAAEDRGVEERGREREEGGGTDMSKFSFQ